jgi:septal ring factor EnvC (AmiA/AmiB activator)
LRQQCIAAASTVQQHEQVIPALEHDTELLSRDADGRQRGLDESRGEQTQLLGEIERIALHPPDSFAIVPGTPVDRLRSGMLLLAVVPALHTEARALSGEIERITALRKKVATKQDELVKTRKALAEDRERAAQLIAQRRDLTRRLLPADAGSEAQIAKLGHEAKDLGDLAKRAEAAADRRDKERLSRTRAALPKAKANALTADAADPTRPHDLRNLDQQGETPAPLLTLPIAGAIGRQFGARDPTGSASQGLRLDPQPAAVVIAPFDGKVTYAGPFSSLGLVLIIRHGGLYHSLLAGLGRIDVAVGDWVLAREPVGIMPEMSGRALYVELRRDGRPVDPQPWLATSDEGRPREPDRQNGDQKVRE